MSWLHNAISRIEADYQRSADTHLIALPLPAFATHGIDLYLKDESTHPTGSLKHRLARSLFLYSLCNGWLREGSTVVESSSGSTAVSEAYFARLLGCGEQEHRERRIRSTPGGHLGDRVDEGARLGGGVLGQGPPLLGERPSDFGLIRH